MEESKLFLNPYDNVVRVVILIIGINKIIMNNLFNRFLTHCIFIKKIITVVKLK